MHRITAVFLVLLRLAIGWHFLFEGLQKLQSHYVGVTATNRPFSSVGYFREAPGPMGGLVRWATGDPDEQALLRLIPLEREEGAEPSKDSPGSRLPPGLRKDWESLAARYVAEYKVDADRAKALLDQHAAGAVSWLEFSPDPILERVRARFGKMETVETSLLSPEEGVAYKIYADNTTEQKRTFASGDVTRRMTMAERIAEYRLKLADLADAGSRKAWRFGKDVEGARLRTLKAEAARIRDGLLSDLEKSQTGSFIRALNNLAASSVADPIGKLAGIASKAEKAGMKDLAQRLALAVALNKDLAAITPAEASSLTVTPINLKALKKQVAELSADLPRIAEKARKEAAGLKGDSIKQGQDWADLIEKTELKADSLANVEKLEPLPPDPLIWWMDFLTRWGLTVIGACLLAGLLTRLNCWLAAGFLLMTYLAVPALPWLPSAGPSEGNYLFVNKNVVEMLALCVLGTLPTGRWFGADGLLAWLWHSLFGKTED